MRRKRCCSAVRRPVSPAAAPAAAATVAPASGEEALAGWPWAAVWLVDLATGDTSELPAEGDDETEAATAAPETGPVGVAGATGGVMTGGRKSAPYAGKGPAGVALTGATGAGAWPLVITGATDVMVVSAGGDTTGAGLAAAAASGTCCTTGALAGIVGVPAIGGAVNGVAGESGWVAACSAPSDRDWVPAAAGAPVIMPVVNDWLNDCGDSGAVAAAGDAGAETPGTDGPPIAGTPGGGEGVMVFVGGTAGAI
ncbi:hypothetical protein LAUMK142_03228 [Mycobacterium pseudokansasii]|uniref:Uncharacterized protein n=1 Tax=Mycobacterium pseudokansasii TaxID=2341080 RepID=A0A498QQ82_9MYCO|nr:hypothetical protein LAUMK142_03228 [Mycobacterium pseudokansasii]